LRTLQQAAPNAEFILWGPEDVAGAGSTKSGTLGFHRRDRLECRRRPPSPQESGAPWAIPVH